MKRLCKIRDIQRAVYIFEQDFENYYGICLNEGMVLCSLSKSEQLSSGEIADLLGLTTSNTSKIIASAEKKCLIERVLCMSDKRRMYFSLSDNGKKLLIDIEHDEIEAPPLLAKILKEITE